ncbi:uncharacterized protein RCC_09412 [Ramularia collo-cygni]|uniref:Carrier domain-containing protein n=1 Tax=Ramularia collo-cygni TaxID=112498 RepID=A0A2D3VP81_9PEZI|nr:uncharacterized protein RCC_09412 [Ramularia collo-cygni]CZT23698.1 uncharacterized protein RCC_09412 [Ramularia collo-cygni]
MTVKRMSEREYILAVLAKALNVSVPSLDISKSFTELGGHSLSAVEVQHGCKNGKLANSPSVLSLLVSPSIEALLPDDETEIRCLKPLQEVAPVKLTAKDPLQSSDGIQAHAVSEIDNGCVVPALEEPVVQNVKLGTIQHCSAIEAPATDMQAGLIRGCRSTINYYETWTLVDVVLIQHAWKKVIAVEPIFRTEFFENDSGELMMRLEDQHGSQIEWDETFTFDQQSYQAAIDKVLAQTQNGPAFHFHTIVFAAKDTGRSEATIVLSVHHALLDGCSMDLLVEKVRRAASGGPLAGPGTSFLNAATEVKKLHQHYGADAEEFWRGRRMSHPNATPSMGLAPPSMADNTPGKGEVSMSFSHLQGTLEAQCRSLGVTVAAFFHAAWALVQAAYSDSDDVVLGTILSGRNLPVTGIGSVVGPLVNSLPLHVSIARDMETAEFVQQVFVDLAEMSGFQWSTPAHGFEREFEAALSVSCGLKCPSNAKLQPLQPPTYVFESSIPLSIALDQASLSMRLVYHTQRYDRQMAEGLADSFVSALTGLASSSTGTVQQCLSNVMTVPMQGHLRVLGNCLSGATTRAAHETQDLVDVFDEAVKQNGAKTALDVGEGCIWTYSDVNEQSRQLAAELARMGLQPGDVVCVHADGSASWVLGLLATLRAGGVFCSLDASLPHALRSAMFRTSGSRVCVVGQEWQRKFLPEDDVPCLVVETALQKRAGDITSEPSRLSHPETTRICRAREPAYLCFTSGSTGTPKGVLCTHQALVAFQKDEAVRLGARTGVRIAQFMSPGFDGSIHEIFSALSYGATLVLRRNVDPFEVLSRVDSAIMTPSVARTISPQEFPNLQRVSPLRLSVVLGANENAGLPRW